MEGVAWACVGKSSSAKTDRSEVCVKRRWWSPGGADILQGTSECKLSSDFSEEGGRAVLLFTMVDKVTNRSEEDVNTRELPVMICVKRTLSDHLWEKAQYCALCVIYC